MGAAGWLGKAAVKELLKRSPKIVEAATQILGTLRSQRHDVLETGDDQLENVLRVQAEQAEIIQKLSQQVVALTAALQVLSRRVAIATAISVASLIAVIIIVMRVYR